MKFTLARDIKCIFAQLQIRIDIFLIDMYMYYG